MSIEIISTRENEDDQTVFFKLTYDGEDYEFHGDCPKTADPQTHFENMEDGLKFLILQRMYRKDEMWADWQRFKTGENTDVEAFEAWVEDGCKNQIEVGTFKNGKIKYEYVVIEKLPFRSTHPLYLKKLKKINEALIDDKLKTLLKDVIKG